MNGSQCTISFLSSGIFGPIPFGADTTAKVWKGGHVDIIESEVYRGGKEIYLCPQKKQRRDLEYFNFHVSMVYLSSA